LRTALGEPVPGKEKDADGTITKPTPVRGVSAVRDTRAPARKVALTAAPIRWRPLLPTDLRTRPPKDISEIKRMIGSSSDLDVMPNLPADFISWITEAFHYMIWRVYRHGAYRKVGSEGWNSYHAKTGF
jgi:hypothetical protein